MRICFYYYLYWTIVPWIIVYIIRKDVYLPGQSKQRLIGIILTNINNEQYNYYNGSSISHAQIALTITYPHFRSFNTLQIFLSTISSNKKISISLLHKHLQKYQLLNYYQLFIIHLHKYLLLISIISTYHLQALTRSTL